MAIEDQAPEPERQDVDAQPAAPAAPEAPIDLGADPFGAGLGEGVQVAGGGFGAIRPFLKRLLGRKGAEEGGEEAVEAGVEAGIKSANEDVLPPTMTPGPKGPMPGAAEIRTGTTRALPNPGYFDSPETKNVLTLLERNAARRIAGPVQTHAETVAKAAEVAELQRLTGKQPDLTWAPEELTALRMSLDAQSKDLYADSMRLMEMRRAGLDIPQSALADFEMKSQRLVATNNAVAGLSSQAGKLLNALRIPANSDSEAFRHLASIVDQGGGAETIAEKVAVIAKTGGNTAKVNQAVEDSWRTRTWDAILKVRYNMMLSSVRSHGANIAGSTLAGAYETALIDPLAYIYNLTERGIRKVVGKGPPAGADIPVNAYPAELRGIIDGAWDGLQLARDMALGREVPAESWQGKFINESGMRYRPQDLPETALGKIGTTPTRMLEAEDAFFRSVYFNKRLRGLAAAEATARAGGDRAVYREQLQELLDNPTPDMRQQAQEYSQRLTFTNDPSLYGKMIGGMARAAANLQDVGPFRLILPFVRTPSNLLGYSLEASGIGKVVAPLKTYREIYHGNPRERAEALSRVTVGVGMLTLLYDTWAEGKITGIGSGNFQATRLMESKGWKPNSYKADDGTYYELNRLDPLGLTMAMAASTFEIWNEQNMSEADKTVASLGVLMQMGDLMLDRSYLSTFGQAIDALKSGAGGTKSAASIGVSTVTSTILPNFLRDFREVTDPFRREQAWDVSASGIMDRFYKNMMNALPGYSKQLPVALDWKGEPITNDGHYLVRGFLPVRMSETEDWHQGTNELLMNNVFPNKPRTIMSIPDGRGFKLELLSLDGGKGHVYSYYQQLVGKKREEFVARTVESLTYEEAVESGNDGTKDSEAGRMLASALSRATDAAKFEMLQALDEEREVTLYPGTGAEVKVQLPFVDTLEMQDFMAEYMAAIPEVREQMEMPPSVRFEKAPVRPEVQKLVGQGPRF